MGGQQRKTLGERISARLAARGARRVRVGPSPTFFARMGMPDPAAGAAAPGGGDFVYVSGTPFYEMMRRLARARLRRQERLSRYERAASRRSLGASRRLWPAKRTRMAHMFGPAVLSESDLVLPEPPPAVSEEEVEERGKPRIVDGWTGRVKKSGRPSVWHARATLPPVITERIIERAPAPVQERAASADRTGERPSAPVAARAPEPRSARTWDAAPTRTREQPVDRLSRRLAAATAAQDPIVSAVQASGRPLPRKLVRVIEEVSHLPAEEQLRIVRRTVRQMGGSVRVVREQLESRSPEQQAPPVAVAAGRMATRHDRRRGLRPVLSGSPMMTAITPPPPVAPELEASRGQAPPRVSAWKSQPRTPRKASRTATSSAAASTASRTASRAPRRAPARGAPTGRPRASAEAGLEGPPPPPAPSTQPAARTAPSAHLAARAVMAAEPQARGRSVLPRVTPASVASAAPRRTAVPDAETADRTPSRRLDDAPVGAVRAARRVQIGLSRPGSVLPRITAPDQDDAALAPATRARPRRREPARGQTRRMAAVYQAPSAEVIAPPEAPAATAEASAPAAAPRRSAWKQTARPVQQASRRIPAAPEARSLVPRPMPRAEAPALQRTGSARRALVRQQSAQPVGRSILPRLTRVSAPARPGRVSTRQPALTPAPTQPVSAAPTVAQSASVSRRSSPQSVTAPAVVGSAAPQGTVSATGTAPAAPRTSSSAPTSTVESPVQQAIARAQAEAGGTRRLSPADSPVQQAIARTQTEAEAPRLASARRMRISAPSEVFTEPLRPEATPEVAPASVPSRSAWGPSPGARDTVPRAARARVAEAGGVLAEAEVAREVTASSLRAAMRRSVAAEVSEQGSLLPRLRAEAPLEDVKTRPVRAALARQASATPREGSILPRATRSTAEARQRRPRRMQAIAPSAVDIQPDAARVEAEAATARAPAARRSAWGPSPGARTQVVAARGATSAQQAQARQIARRGAAPSSMRPTEKAARRTSASPLVGYSARSSQGKRRIASVDVKLRRRSPSPVSYARGTQTIYVELPPEPSAAPQVAPKPKAAKPAAVAAPKPRRAPSIFDVGAPVKRAAAPQPEPTSEPSEPTRRLVRKRVGPTARPLDRVGVRADAPEVSEALPVYRGAWADSRVMPGERGFRSPRLWTGPDGVVVQAPPDAAEVAEDAPQQQRRSAWVAPRAAQPARGTQPTAEAGVPAPWSRPVWTRGRSARPSSRLPRAELSRAARTSRGVYVSQRVARSAAPVRDFQYPSAAPAAGAVAEEQGQGQGRRVPLAWTLEAVDARSDNRALPGWAQRASEKPRITGSDDLLRQLAGAREVSEVVRVIFERSGETAPVMRQVSSPVLQVIQQIRAEAHKAAEPQAPAAGKTVTATASGGGPRKAMRRGGPQPRMQQLSHGMTGLRTMASAPSSEGVGEDKVSKLARRLRDLIHLAEVKNRRDQARQGVRMAEDSAAARAEGQSSPTESEGNVNTEQVDIDALSREVLDHVQREQQLRQERRIDGGDSGDFWW